MIRSLRPMLGAPGTRSFLLFLATGGLAAAINLVTRFLLSTVLLYEIAVALAYLVGMAVAFLLFRRFVFKGGENWAAELRRFILVNVFAFVLVWVVSVGLGRFLFPLIGFRRHAMDVAHLIGVLCPAVSSYIGHQRYTFAAPAGRL